MTRVGSLFTSCLLSERILTLCRLKIFQTGVHSYDLFRLEKFHLKVIVTVKSSGCLQIGFGPPIIDYNCNFFIQPQ